MLIERFHGKIKIGPEYICTCCDQSWNGPSVSLCSKSSYNKCSKDIVDCCVTGVNSDDYKSGFAQNVIKVLKSDKLPGFSNANKMMFPEKPQCLNLTSREERLISPRVPFMVYKLVAIYRERIANFSRGIAR